MGALPVRHIGEIFALCDRRKRANLRPDLGAERYRQLGVKERFVGEAPYRVCPACIKRSDRWYEYAHAARKKERK
jgi:hypothetical protein